LITLADAGPGDEDAIARLCTELDRFYGAASAGTPTERAAQVRAVLFTDPPMARALLAWDGTTLAGFAAYSFLWPAAGLTASLYLKELYVARAHRRGGTGKLIMERLYGIAVSKGCSRVEWTTDTGNTAAQAFYDALGATPLPTKIFYRDAVAPESGR
jgi:GNAT superfamily N-acetyltransferase